MRAGSLEPRLVRNDFCLQGPPVPDEAENER
jgi:hypothetical protein